MSEMSELMDFINSVAGVGQNIATAQLNYAKAEEAQIHKEKLLNQKAEREDERLLLKQNTTLVNAAIKDQDTEIDRLLQVGQDYNVSMFDYLNLSTDDQTPEMKELIKLFAEKCNIDLSLSTQIYDTGNEMLSGLNTKSQVNNLIIRQLTDMEADFY